MTTTDLWHAYHARNRAVFLRGEVAYALNGADDKDGDYAAACNEARIAQQYYDNAIDDACKGVK